MNTDKSSRRALSVGKILFHLWILVCVVSVVPSTPLHAKTKKVTRKVQEVNFGEMSLKGTIRNPDGAFLVQKKGIKFLPLHDVQKDMDAKIREASFYVR
jgi:hypothetical protein